MDTPAPRRLTGVVVAGAALLVQWVAHLFAPELPFPPLSVASWLVRRTPGPLATAAIEALGHRAMQTLAVGAVVAALALGWLAARAHPIGHALAAGVATVVAGALDPAGPRATIVLATAALGAGTALAVSASQRPPLPERTDGGRRALIGAGALVGLAGLGGVGLVRRVGRHVAQGAVRIDTRARVARDAAFESIRDLSRSVTSRGEHYTVDIDFLDPSVSAGGWRLRIDGAVDRPQRLTLDDLRAMPITERHAVLSCISNEVGGDLVGSARWAGVPLASLLSSAGVRPGAISIEARGVDGYSDSIPIAAAMDPSTLVAIAMNGSLLPRGHGFPARLRVPSRYGIKNVKWLESLTVRTADVDGYWEERGWDAKAIVKTESRIDTPVTGATVPSQVTVAGVAWAGARRVARVEVSTDDGRTWSDAVLEPEADPLAWRRWRADLRLPKGRHVLVVRATDGDGTTQTADRAAPHPDGASGWHHAEVTVTA